MPLNRDRHHYEEWLHERERSGSSRGLAFRQSDCNREVVNSDDSNSIYVERIRNPYSVVNSNQLVNIWSAPSQDGISILPYEYYDEIDWGSSSYCKKSTATKFVYLKPNNCTLHKRSKNLKELNTLERFDILNIEHSWLNDGLDIYSLIFNGLKFRVSESEIDKNRKII